MELVLPNNYVALEQEEMMYIDGGAAIFSAAAIRKAIKANKGAMTRTLRSMIIKHVGSAAAHLASGALDIALTVSGFSLGGAVAYGADWADGKLDGYVFA